MGDKMSMNSDVYGNHEPNLDNFDNFSKFKIVYNGKFFFSHKDGVNSYNAKSFIKQLERI